MSSSSTASNKRKRSCDVLLAVDDGAGVHAMAAALGGEADSKTTCAACKTNIPCQHPGSMFFQLRGKCTHILCAACMNKAHCLRCQRAWNECLVCPVENCKNTKVRDYVGFTTTVDAEDGQLRRTPEEYEIHVPLTLSHLDANLIARVLSNLDWEDIIKVSIACKDIYAASKGMIYEAELRVDTERTANNLVNIGKALKIQGLRIEPPDTLQELKRDLRLGKHIWDMNRVAIHDDSIIAGQGHSNRERRVEGTVDLNAALSALPHLKALNITQKGPKLDGFYPAIFDLTNLRFIQLNCEYLRVDLASFEAMSYLLAIDLAGCREVSGSLTALNHLQHTLVLLNLRECRAVRGKLNDLSHFLTLKGLDLSGTNVSGSICDLRPGDFPDLRFLYLNSVSIYGSYLESLLDAERLMTACSPRLQLPAKSTLHSFAIKKWILSKKTFSPKLLSAS